MTSTSKSKKPAPCLSCKKLRKELSVCHDALETLASEDTDWKAYWEDLFEKELLHWRKRAEEAEDKVVQFNIMS